MTSASGRISAGFRWSALVNAIVAVILLGLGVSLAFGQLALIPAHSGMAMLFVVTSLVAAVFAVLYALRSGPRGLIAHAVGLVVLALIQYSLGEMGNFTVAHIVVGLLVVAGAVALYVMASRRTGTQS